MNNLIVTIQERYHPLFYLRKFRLFQLLTRLLNFPISIRFQGIEHTIYGSFSKNLSFLLTAGKSGEMKERHNFSKITNTGGFQSFYDVGANIGIYGFLFKCLVPLGKVVMVEPDPENFSLIQRTIAKHHLQDITVIEAAVYDCEGTIEFYEDAVTGATGSIERDLFIARHHNIKPSKITVKAVTLDSMSQLLMFDPDFIKMDVEGAELKALQGSTVLIKRAHPAIFFECSNAKEEVLNFFQCNGYILFDFTTLEKIDNLCHNNLALHKKIHKELIAKISS